MNRSGADAAGRPGILAATQRRLGARSPCPSLSLSVTLSVHVARRHLGEQ
jgi:hypothetical protein